jgi:hypothetical protein
MGAKVAFGSFGNSNKQAGVLNGIIYQPHKIVQLVVVDNPVDKHKGNVVYGSYRRAFKPGGDKKAGTPKNIYAVFIDQSG